MISEKTALFSTDVALSSLASASAVVNAVVRAEAVVRIVEAIASISLLETAIYVESCSYTTTTVIAKESYKRNSTVVLVVSSNR